MKNTSIFSFCFSSFASSKNSSTTRFGIMLLIILSWVKPCFSQNNVSYIPFYTQATFDAKQVDQSKPVGVVLGTAGVSNGAATYTIPFTTAPRPSGMNHYNQTLAINYNSSSGDGSLGRGWSLSAGVSFISRRSRTILLKTDIHHHRV